MPRDGLTRRQRQVLALLMKGWSSREIGTELGIAAETVDNHAYYLLRRYGCANRLELVCKLWARECAALRRQLDRGAVRAA